MKQFKLTGLETEQEVKEIKRRLNGKTYMNFIVDYVKEGNTYSILYGSQENYTDEEIQNYFFYCLFSNIGK